MTPFDVPVRDLPDVDLFSGLSETEQAALAARFAVRPLRRGDVLMRQGDPAEALHVVVSGRFAVTIEGRPGTVSEISAGQPVGEIAFLTGALRTATVTAMRDSLVLGLSRPEFDALVAEHPGIWRTLTATLARRLAATTSRSRARSASTPRPRTLCLIAAGQSRLAPAFVTRLADALRQRSELAVVTEQTAADLLGAGRSFEGAEATQRLNALEAGHDYVLLAAGDEVSSWTEKAIRHADMVLAVAPHGARPAPNAVEELARRFVAPEATRLVLLHATRTQVAGTARWLEGRAVGMHHHVALDTDEDVDRLVRFIDGRAMGFVACGGGALAAAHTGVFKGLGEAGLTFDIVGGTSAGSALAAAFLLSTDADEIDRQLGEMFVANGAMRRYTLPRYGLLDHTVFDGELRRLFGEGDIEDLWLPFFAVSTNLSRFSLMCHRRGRLWRAIRASSSIPVLLPPVYTAEGDMLVDGCLLDNVPIKVMHELKDGPNVVVTLKPPQLDRFDVDYDALPARGALLMRAMNPLRRDPLPDAPGLIAVLMRALMANRRDFQRELAPDDIALMPPIPDDMGFLDWHRHGELFEGAYRWTRARLAGLGPDETPQWLAERLRR
jgi:NTE family protein